MNSITGLPNEALFDGRDVSIDGAAQDAHIADSSLHFTAASLSTSYIPLVGGVADNVVAKFHTDGTVQASGVVISDTTNDITGVGDLTLGGSLTTNNISVSGTITTQLETVNDVAMTSNILPAGYVSSASNQTSISWKNFDKTTAVYQSDIGLYSTVTGIHIGGGSTTIDGVAYAGEWVQLQLPSVKNISSFSLGLWNTTHNPKNFKVAGSLDGTNWTELYSTTDGDTLGFVIYDGTNESQIVVNLDKQIKVSYLRLCINTIKINGNSSIILRQITYFDDFSQIDKLTNTLINTDTIHLSGDIIKSLSTPASATAAGVVGSIRWDANFIYVCTSTNTWKRISISSW